MNIILTIYAISTIMCVILVTHLAFFQRRFDFWAINTVRKYIEFLIYAIMPFSNTIILIIFLCESIPFNKQLKKFVKK